ncbi:poly [ADP-ribose] polymerase [Elysia marginata]|uniref:Poly [ADP-ribose] polymerase n=1 Tax=Elysia marginata TaxID=1093978 RepID=A0AAV4F4S0_9GAST|nr:poly [ADP-ribose] polymerase [Elysia marginata]
MAGTQGIVRVQIAGSQKKVIKTTMESDTKSGATASEVNAPATSENVAASGSSGRKRKARTVDVIEPRTPLKRQRVPVSRFQSPLEDAEPKFKSEAEEKKKEENINLYKKGAFLAVRGAEGTFYLCRTAQNVYSKSRRLRIQWLSVDTPPNDYKFDYVDSTEMETVLTEIKMEKVSRDIYRLPVIEKKRIETILDRALRVEKGIATADEVEEEAMEDARDQEEEEEDDDDDEPPKSRKRTPKASKAKKSSGPTPAQKKKLKEKEKLQKEKKKAQEKAAKQKTKVKGPDRNLKPNPKIKVLEKDPFFETKEKVPEISALMTSKLAFRALNTNNIDDLKVLLEKTEGVTNFEIGRSAQDDRTVLEMAGLQGKKEFIKVLTDEYFNSKSISKKNRKAPPAPIISSVGTGSYNPAYLGIRAIRSLNVSRGNREGNDAFLKEEQQGNVDSGDVVRTWMEQGVQEEILDTFITAVSVADESTKDDQLHNVIDCISRAVSRGHYKLAGKYVAEAERLGGFGFNYLHKQVLTFETEDLKDIIFASSVRKKPFSNDAITPLHCAAVNPNVKYLTRLLSIEPDINLQTRSRARPIHFSAACEGTAPLEFLLKRNASPNEADSSGDLPIHYASRSGRSKNIEVLLKHAKSNVATEVVSEKWGLGNVNRPNRFAMCPLHMAVEEGHLDAVRTLIKYGADVNKALSAGKDKMTPLMIAARRGDLPLARILIQSGAAVEILDKMKRSALTHAIMNGSANVASYLLYLGADPNRVDSSNNTLVHYAAAYGWYFCLKLLIKDAGAKPDEPNIWQTTPIGIAFLKGNYGLVEMLFQNKDVNIDFQTDDGMTLASTACKSLLVPGLDSQIKSLIQNFKADPTIKDVNGFNALHHLAANDIKVKGSYWNRAVDNEAMQISVKIAQLLIAAGCDPTLRTNEGKTPTMLAIEQVNVDLVRFLVENGGTVSPEKNASEKTVLHLMAEQCCTTNLTPMLHILAEHAKVAAPVEEDPKAIKENGKVNNVDHVPEKKTSPESMEVDGAGETKSGDGAENKVSNEINGDPHAPDAKGDAASVTKECKEVSPKSQVAVLKAMAKERDFVGFTPFLRACHVYRTFKANKKDEKEKAEHARAFIQALLAFTESDVNAVVGPKNMPDEPEEHYAPEGKMSAVHMMVNVENEDESNAGAGMAVLFRFAANANQKDKDGKTPLVLAVEGSREKIVKLLLENGADPNVEINHGYYKDTPLVLATARGSLQIMRMLIQYKAEVTSCRSDSLSTPLHLMVTNRVHEDETISMLQLLLKSGAKINSVDKNGNTPLHLAVSCNKGHSDTSTSLEEFLLEKGADMMAKNNDCNMPLHQAVHKDGTDPIELCSLLTSMMRDQRLDEPNKSGYTPLLYAASSGATICCMHLLQRGANLEARESRGNTPLNMAIYGGYDSCAIMLMQRNASLNYPIVVRMPHTKDPTAKESEEEKKKKKRPTLNWRPKLQWESLQPRHFPGETITIFEGAVKKDLTGVAHMLLDGLGMPMEAVEAALNLSKFYLALRLIRRIPDVSQLHAKNKEGQNLFHVLANKTSRNDPDLQLKVAAALLEKGIPLGECDKRGVTPLMYAALRHQSVKLAKFLIDYDKNFNPKVKDSRNRDIMAAFMWDYSWISDNFKLNEVKEWMDTLIDKGGISLNTLYDHPLPDPLLLGAKYAGPELDFFDATQAVKCLTSPLIFAIRNYNFGLAKFMLQKGASPNFPDSDGITPLMHAIQMNDVKMVKLLLNPDYEAVSGYMQEDTSLKHQLSNEPSREVMTINFEVPAKDNPDDILDEDAGEDDEEDQVSLSKHTEENEDSVDLEEDEEPQDDDDVSEHDEDDAENDDDGGDSDHDTDVADDDEPEQDVEVQAPSDGKPNLPSGAMKLTLTRHVSQITKERVFETVPKTSSVDLSKADPQGWTALHHAVCPLAAATFDNTEIVFLLCKAGAPLEVQNKAGDTAADLARKHNSEKIFRQLQKLGLKDDKPFEKSPEGFAVDECVPDKTKPDIEADSEAMLTKLDAAAGVKPDSDDSPKVDSNCDIKKAGEVARSETNIPYSVTLSKVDVTCGVWGMYNFYKLQIVQHTAKKLFILFTRWGRIGDRGQFQHTPFQTLAEAAKEFCKIYKSKTGNDWNQKTQFQNHPKKYRLMPKAEKQHKQHKVDFNFESSIPSKLPEPVFDLLSEMSSVNMLEASIQKVGLNEDFMPFGRMKRKTLIEARRVLTDISELIEKVVKLRNNLTTDLHAEYQSNCEEIAKLTNEYYHLVPIYGFEHETIQPISEKKMLREHTKLLADLMDLQVANTILLGANLRKSEMNPIDYIYSSLGCRIQPMAENDPQTQFILTNIHASAPSARINRVFRIAREGEDQQLADLNLPNHQLLWHGSSMSNFISILSRGLLVTPPEVPCTGHLFGEGIYFADTFVKSANYCHNHSNKSTCKVMLLCEVALGNPKVDVKHGDEDHLDDDINSLKILGLHAPIPDFDALLPFGATLSLGQIQPMKYHPPARITHNEYIIHKAEQVAIRYLVLYNG